MPCERLLRLVGFAGALRERGTAFSRRASWTGLTIGAMGFSAKSYAAIAGANERINVGVIGIRNQGTVHLNSLCSLKDSHHVHIRAICDTDEALR